MDISMQNLPAWARPGVVLNPAYQPESGWAQALAAGHEEDALHAFLEEMRNGPPRLDMEFSYVGLVQRWYGFRLGHQGGHDYWPDQVIARDYIGAYGIRHKFEGEIDWLFDPTVTWGPEHTWEWQVQFNRHYQWVPLAEAWKETGNAAYARAFESELLSWVGSQCPRPPALDMRLPGTWRTIEVGIRSGWTWPYAFEIFRQCAEVSDLALWLLIAALREHGYYLLYHPRKGNFKTMESNGLAHVGLLFPELEGAYSFATTAIDRCMAEMERQFYPDGLQTELAPSYGLLSVANIYCALQLARRRSPLLDPAGNLLTLPPQSWWRLQQLGTALARIAMPDGNTPALNDSRATPVGPVYEEMRRLPGGGIIPENPPFRNAKAPDSLPWSGYGILRRPDRFALMDAGPYSTGHSHQDALHVILHNAGLDWCMDSGCPPYDQSETTRLLRNAPGHNLVLMDGEAHQESPLLRRVEVPLPMDVGEAGIVQFVAAQRTKKSLEEPSHSFRHERILLDVGSLGWLVLDRLQPQDEVPHTWEWLWHFPVEASLSIEKESATVRQKDEKTGKESILHILTRSQIPLSLSNVAGRTKPSCRGWSVTHGTRDPHPIPTLQVCSGRESGTICTATLFTFRDSFQELTLESKADSIQVGIVGKKEEWHFQFCGAPEISAIKGRFPDPHSSLVIPVKPHST